MGGRVEQWIKHIANIGLCRVDPNRFKKNIPILKVCLLPTGSDFVNSLDGLECVLGEVPVIPFWPITLPLKLKCSILQI